MAKENRERREKIYDDFSRNEYHELCDLFDVEEFPAKFYRIKTKEYGYVDFFPMGDKLNYKIYRRGEALYKKWEDNGLKWIKTNLLKHL